MLHPQMAKLIGLILLVFYLSILQEEEREAKHLTYGGGGNVMIALSTKIFRPTHYAQSRLHHEQENYCTGTCTSLFILVAFAFDSVPGTTNHLDLDPNPFSKK
jgi:hypothetical protein